MLEENRNSKLKQKKLLIITIVSLGAVILIFLSSGPKKSAGYDLSRTIADSKNKIILQDPNQGLKAEDRWLYDAGRKLDDYDKFQKNYLHDKSNIESRLEEVEKRYEDTIEQQASELENLGYEIERLKNQINSPSESRPVSGNQQDPFNPNNSTNNSGRVMLSVAIQSTNLNLEDDDKNKGLFHKASEYVPAGAYAQATIISGVDASVGISSQSDPRPVLLRIKGPAVSSIYDGEAQKADLNGCIITAAASGDLSSEKVFVKLINMTCSKSEDLIYEIAVKGYVAGQGKSGVRGNVISRAGDVVAKSFLAGLVGGFGQGLSAKVSPPLNFSNGLTTQSAMTTQDVLNTGLGQGAASAGDRLSEYYIEKAEQYQPVISVPSGIDVEVVFVEGFRLSEKTNKKDASPSNKSGGGQS